MEHPAIQEAANHNAIEMKILVFMQGHDFHIVVYVSMGPPCNSVMLVVFFCQRIDNRQRFSLWFV